MTALFFVLAFVVAALLDVAHTVYIREVERGNAHAAAAWSVIMYAMGCAGFYLCVNHGWEFMIPEALGYYAGTWVAMRRTRNSLPAKNAMAPSLHGVGTSSPD